MISVIIPVYNAEKYLTHTIRCLQAQTCTDFEVLLVNDGSADRSAQICAESAKADTRFRVLTQENQGVSAARNKGLAASKGEYITFLDADDEVPDNYLETLYRALALCSGNPQYLKKTTCKWATALTFPVGVAIAIRRKYQFKKMGEKL